jgi:hypothetical protein
MVIVDTKMRQSQAQVDNDERERTDSVTLKSISMGLEAMGVLVAVPGKVGGFVMPCWTRRR